MNHRITNAFVLVGALGAIALAVQRNTHLMPHAAATFEFDRERCFGIARAGRNDCGTARHACAGRAPHDASGDEWLSLPAGTCAKIAGGTVKSVSG
ncbi:BufA1 family periplasmic bufferin-type metallophore [Burkholderia sp. PU8-34]